MPGLTCRAPERREEDRVEQPGARRTGATHGDERPDASRPDAAPAAETQRTAAERAQVAPRPASALPARTDVPTPRDPQATRNAWRDHPGDHPAQGLVPGASSCSDHGPAYEAPRDATTRGDRPDHDAGERRTAAVPVQRHSVRGQVLEALRAAIAAGEFVPGEVYSAPALGARFGVSATPVREAMQRLAHDGAVEVVPNRGFRIAERSARDIAELTEVRALLEVPVVLELARSEPAERWAALRPLAEATETAAVCGDVGRYLEADRAFHRAVLSLAGNRQLVAVADDLHRRAQWPSQVSPVVRRADLVADAAEHTALVDALAAADLPTAESVVRRHFSRTN
ncbi:FCD domain-containing protein [Streptomyces sp. YIM 130001]|uniref:FCD domain-containing protein n=1 Tax=Streptomyces sp. YIM 130001 TaxID=2259644 RepID=UPI001F099867|nr:FCD domain-containing protein [Streptomyces sp. YIM 130001]